jgi:oligopeptidase B
MRRHVCFGLTCLSLVALVGLVQAQPGGPKPPLAKKVHQLTELHGETRVDDYYWLRQKKDPEVISYLEAENAYTESVMKPTEPLQEKLYKEFLARIQQTDLSVRIREGNYWYYTRTEKGQQYPTHCRKEGSQGGEEQVMLDVNELAKGHKFYSVGGLVVSDDGNLLAYSSDITGFREYILHVKNLTTGAMLPDTLTKIRGFVWASDSQTLFYTTEDHAKRPYRLWRHKLGDAQKNDTLLYEEKDELFSVSVNPVSPTIAIQNLSELRNVRITAPTESFGAAQS